MKKVRIYKTKSQEDRADYLERGRNAKQVVKKTKKKNWE